MKRTNTTWVGVGVLAVAGLTGLLAQVNGVLPASARASQDSRWSVHDPARYRTTRVQGAREKNLEQVAQAAVLNPGSFNQLAERVKTAEDDARSQDELQAVLEPEIRNAQKRAAKTVQQLSQEQLATLAIVSSNSFTEMSRRMMTPAERRSEEQLTRTFLSIKPDEASFESLPTP